MAGPGRHRSTGVLSAVSPENAGAVRLTLSLSVLPKDPIPAPAALVGHQLSTYRKISMRRQPLVVVSKKHGGSMDKLIEAFTMQRGGTLCIDLSDPAMERIHRFKANADKDSENRLWHSSSYSLMVSRAHLRLCAISVLVKVNDIF